MALTCPSCRKSIQYVGERPSFCAYCGEAFGSARSTQVDATVDFAGSEDDGGGSSPVAATLRSTRLPESIAGYRLIRVIGRGGMGSVHEAEDSSSGRRVAIKMISPDHVASETSVERFLQEGRLASAIAHPRCVFVVAADQAEGWPYIVMELMPGHTLKDLVETGGPLPQGEAVRKIMDVIEGLEEAHKLGVIHRDVKPSNCFLDAEGRVKVGDFGLSKSLVGSDANLTRTGSFVGTPHYASPEQIKGEETDARSDVYSVAATLYYLLTGRPPFDAADATVALARIVSEEPAPVRALRPDVWAALDEVVIHGLQRDRKRRVQSLEELRRLLEPFTPGGVSVGRLGLRVMAYVIDACATAFVTFLVIFLADSAASATGLPTFLKGPLQPVPDLTSGLVALAYFFTFEVIGKATPGKQLLNLHLASVTRGGLIQGREGLIRLAVFSAVVFLPHRVLALLIAPAMRMEPQVVTSLVFGVTGAGLLLLFSTARASNGYRGLHELASGTGVITVPRLLRGRRTSRAIFDATQSTLHVSQPEGLPRTVGGFAIGGSLLWTPARRLLIGEDEGLGRPVWIVMQSGDGPSLPDGRKAIDRLTRPRWLAAGEEADWRWDAFVAPVGRSLSDVVAESGPIAWPHAREILEGLAEELDLAAHDGTLPPALALDRVWLQPDGRVLLLDEALDTAHHLRKEIVGADDQLRGLELLRETAILALRGEAAPDVGQPIPVGAPVPEHAIASLDRLCRLGARFESLAEFRAELVGTADAGRELTRFQKTGFAAYTCVAVLARTLILPSLFVVGAILSGMVRGTDVRSADAALQMMLAEDAVTYRVMLVFAAVCIAYTFIVRAGLGGLFFDVSIVGRDGRRAPRWRVALREAWIWIPLLLADWLIEAVPKAPAYRWLNDLGFYAVVVVAPFVYVAYQVFECSRYLNDRLAGTAIAPR